MSAVTVPMDKLIELQKKAKAVDELRAVNALIMDELTDQVRVIGNLEKQIDELLAALIFAKDMMIANDLSLPRTFEVIDEAIAKVKGDQ